MRERETEIVRTNELNEKKEIVIMLTSKLNFDFRECLPNTNDNN